jgi:protein involved in polysaccharide export with SLBB domain
VQVTGAVERPGIYGAAETKNLKSLLSIAVPREDAYLAHAVISRVNTLGESSLQSFNVEQVLKGNIDFNLQSEDSVHIYTKSAIRETYTVVINGEVNKPGKYNFLDKMNAMDLVLMAGGFSEGASRAQVEISGRLRNTTLQTDSMVYAIIKTINLDQDQAASLRESTLEPFDIVSVRRSPLYKTQLRVNLEGEVLYPGTYVLAGKQERLSDLVKRAGGLRDQAYPQGATLLRTTYTQNFISDTLLVEAKNQVAQKNKEVATAEQEMLTEIPAGKYDQDSLLTEIKKRFLKPVGIQLGEALKNPGSREDIYLEEGDVLRIPRQLQTVQTFGAVNVPKQIVYYPGLRYRSVIRQSGGFGANAYRKRGYAVYANGQVSNAKQFLFFRSNPVIRPGAEIYVPLKLERKGISTGEAVGIVSGLASVLGFLVIILRQ